MLYAHTVTIAPAWRWVSGKYIFFASPVISLSRLFARRTRAKAKQIPAQSAIFRCMIRCVCSCCKTNDIGSASFAATATALNNSRERPTMEPVSLHLQECSYSFTASTAAAATTFCQREPAAADEKWDLRARCLLLLLYYSGARRK